MRKNTKLLAALITSLVFALNSGCNETPITEIVPYSGSWNFAFSYNNGTVFANSKITVQDTGTFCGVLVLAGSSSQLYIHGDVSDDGTIKGGFDNDCSGSFTGSIKGSFTEVMGMGYASGTFSDSLQNPLYKGVWQARRN